MEIRITHVIELSPALMSLVTAAANAAAPEDDSIVYRQPAPKPAPVAAVEAAPVVEAVEQEQEPALAGDDAAIEVDASGAEWSAELHSPNKTKTKDGNWRVKSGAKKDTGTSTTGSEAPAGDTANETVDEDDEFAAFKKAANESVKVDEAAAKTVPARKFTDADLGALCNQAAQKLGSPDPVKALIAEFVPEGSVPHSRNIPDERRAGFAAAVEAKAGIEFTA